MARDYRREEQRRNELARERGFRTRAEQRYKSEAERDAERAGFDSAAELASARRQASKWSRRHSHIAPTKYQPHGKDKNAESFGKYYRAFVDVPQGDRWSHRPEFEEYLVDETGYYTEDEFDAKYGEL